MQKINGKYASAVIYAEHVDDYAVAQIKMICDNEAAVGSKICVMPDVHPGKVGPIGLTMTVGEKILPALVGIDIGCGIRYSRIKQTKIEFQKLDRVIRDSIPSGFSARKEPHSLSQNFDFDKLLCRKHINQQKAQLSLGTLGGGNHFIELNKDKDGSIYAFVHSGSRHLGKEVAEFYLREGQRRLAVKGIKIPYELTYLEGQLMEDYLHDLQEVQKFAMLNRQVILYELVKHMKWKELESGESIHNYVDEKRILRKGAVTAEACDKVIIPVNMKDGVILGRGKGNSAWNCSAPHGAGRVMKRSEVKNAYTLSAYKKAMAGIYSSSITRETLEESPFAYRNMQTILEAIADTVEVQKILKPIYNFKG